MRRFRYPGRILTLTAVLGLALVFWPARALRSDNFVFYLPNGHQVILLEMIGKSNYLPLLRVLNTVVKVEGMQVMPYSLRLWFGQTEMEFRADDKKIRVNRATLALAEPVRMEKGQWLVPLDFLSVVLPQITHQPIQYRVGTHRIFIGDVKPSSFSVRLSPAANGARLTVQFTEPVTLQTAASNGKWVLSLGDRAVEAMEPSVRFQNPYLADLQFDDHDGVPKLILTPGPEGLNFYPVLAGGGKVLEAEISKQPQARGREPQAPPQALTTAAAPPSAPPAPVAEKIPQVPAGPSLPAVVLDAGHGGEDGGARDRNGLQEKDLVAQLVMHAREALLATGKYRVVLTRVGDLNPNFDQRDILANTARPEVFITFHAGNLGNRTPRVMVYTYQFPSPAPSSADDEPRTLFVPWVRVQQYHLARSEQLAEALIEAMAKVPGITAGKPEPAPVRVLRSVNGPAVAIELGSFSPGVDSGAFTDPTFQEQMANAIVQALAAFEGRRS